MADGSNCNRNRGATAGKVPVEFVGGRSANEELDIAIAHLSERTVAFKTEAIYQTVFSHLQSFEVSDLDQAIAKHPDLIKTQDQRFTTAAALEQEIEIVQRWLAGQHTSSSLGSLPDLTETSLNSGQSEAVCRTLLSRDRHQIIHGLSGVGKTTALGVLKRQLEGSGIEIRGYAPTIAAAVQLQSELGIKTNTVAHLTLSQPEQGRDQLWIVDEAGMVSARQMREIGRKADMVGARILLVGDKGQNSSIEAGSPLRSLMNHGATTHSIRQIIRQQNSIQKQAVELIADGNGSAALELLNQNGYVSEIANRTERASAIANQYLTLSQKERDRTLIVTGTNAERLTITKLIRDGLKHEGKLGDSVKVVQLVSRQFTVEQSRQARNYQRGDYIRLHRDYHTTELNKGQLYKVEACQGDELLVSSYGGRRYRLNPSLYKDKEVFYGQELEIAVGDTLRWTTSDKQQGRVNGKQFTVSAMTGTSMTIRDSNGETQDVSLLQPLAVDYNLVSTSYRAQGKTARRVIISATSDPTSSREPFYVKISRQTVVLSVFTQNLDQLRGWVQRSNAQENPLDLLGDPYEPRPVNRDVNPSRHSGPVDPSGGANQRHRPQIQPDSLDDSGAIERLHRAINQAAVGETLRGLRTTLEGLSRVNQQLHRRAASRDDLAGEIRRLGEAVSRANQAPSGTAEQHLTRTIQQQQVAESIRDSLLGLNAALHKVNAIQPTDSRPLVELVAFLQQTVRQIEQRTSQTIRDEKLKVLADAITQWKADSAVTEDFRLQQMAKGITALHADYSAADVLKSQRIASSIHQTRAEDYIYAALADFNQAMSQGIKSIRAGTNALESTLGDLRLILTDRVEMGNHSRELARAAPKLGQSPPTRLKQAGETFPHTTMEPDALIAHRDSQANTNAQRHDQRSVQDNQTRYRTKYNTIAREIRREFVNMTPERLDLEVYLRAIQKGEQSDGASIVRESDTARSLHQLKPNAARHYVQAITSVADTYQRLSRRNVDDLDELMRRAIQRQTVSLERKDEQAITLHQDSLHSSLSEKPGRNRSL